MAVRCPGLWALALVLVSASSAHAYCRTHTDDPAQSQCPEPCPEEGLPLHWPSPKLSYAFNVAGFPDIEDSDLRRIIGSSIETWEEVRCGDRRIGFTSSAAKAPTTLTLGPKADEPNANVIVHFSAQEWSARNMSSAAFAITAVWFDSDTGDILGADMMFNGRMDPFGECPDDGCSGSSPATDLQNVATHEFGHFLGLSHSAVEGSTMWCNADGREIDKRTLAPDDIAGLCAVYPPGEAFEGYRASTTSASCALSTNGAAGGLGSALLVALAVLSRRRRRAC